MAYPSSPSAPHPPESSRPEAPERGQRVERVISGGASANVIVDGEDGYSRDQTDPHIDLAALEALAEQMRREKLEGLTDPQVTLPSARPEDEDL